MAESPPSYDPSEHDVEANPTVQLAMYCSCGGVFTQIDPVTHCLPQIADFREKHAGKGHGSTDPESALTEREERRAASFRVAGRQNEYKPKKRKAPQGLGFNWSKKES